MSDSSFARTTPEQIDSMIKNIRQDATHEENNREESTVANMTKTKDVGRSEKKSKKESKNKKQEGEQLSAKSNPRQGQDGTGKSGNSQDEKKDNETMTVKKINTQHDNHP